MGAAAPRRRSVPGTPGQLYEALRDAAEEDSTGRAVSTTSLMRGELFEGDGIVTAMTAREGCERLT